MKRNILNSPRLLELKRHRRKVFLGKVLFFVFTLSVIFAGLAYVSRISNLNISAIEILGNKTLDATVVKSIVQNEIIGNYLWFFPKTNIFFYPKDNIKKDLFNQFSRLESISLSVKNKVLEVSLTERTALYTWCGDTINLVAELPSDNSTAKEKCYFMDEAGYIFDEAPYFSGDVYFKFYGKTADSYFLKQKFLELIQFKKTLEGMGLRPVAIYVLDDGNARVYLSSGAQGEKPEIRFKADADFQKVAENLQTALTTEPLQSDLKNKYSSLLYIDLRFGNKVVYKFR